MAATIYWILNLLLANLMSPLKNITFVVNKDKTGALDLAYQLETECHRYGCKPQILTIHPVPEDALSGSDLCCVIGGDGTLLSVTQAAVKARVPTLGINLGKLGFMAFNTHDAKALLPDILKGHFEVSERHLLECTCANGFAKIALNDVVIKTNCDAGLPRRCGYRATLAFAEVVFLSHGDSS